MNVIKISASQLVCEQIAVNIAKFDPFLRDALCKSKPSQLILLKVQPVFANFAEYPYPYPSFLPTS